MNRSLLLVLACVVALLSTKLAEAQPVGPIPDPSSKRLICSKLVAKAMPSKFSTNAMVFTGPAGDGRRGSAGFIVPAMMLMQAESTHWRFGFQRAASGYGFQIIHPFRNGHVVVSVASSVAIHRGGYWGDIGWGNPTGSDKVALSSAGKEMLPLRPDRLYTVESILSPDGLLRLSINNILVCQQVIKTATPVTLAIKEGSKIYGGSSWDKTTFKGPDFKPTLKGGDGGLILGPMDGSGPTQHFKDVYLSAMYSFTTKSLPTTAKSEPKSQPPAAKSHPTNSPDMDGLLARVKTIRETAPIKRTRKVGGHRGGPFEELPAEPAVLIGFEYTTSTFYGGHLTIKSLRPIFRSAKGELLGKRHGVPHGKVRRIVAKEDYVVTGIIAKTGHRVDGFRVLFMKARGGVLNPDDVYRSEWLGGKGGGGETLCATNGAPIIGIYGRQGHDLDSIGFLVADRRPTHPPARSLQALLPRLVGNWTVTYTNGTQHTREIHASQKVNESDELVEENGDILIVYENVIERLTLVDDKLFVEHFNPRTNYPNGTPSVIGVALRVKETAK
ncbi:MAG: hypothetical protein CMJ78_02220 [Planctomycetaceae bacterium]|nr:hypothetical protein [Planctomycetaceae bacterium]